MARIRTIKPEFWQDEKLAPLPPIDRLVFLGLISMADDAGRLVDSSRMLNGLLFPHTDDDCRKSLETLARLSRVFRYTSNSGQKLLQIVHWENHQRVDNPSRYCLPPPPPQTTTQQAVTQPSRGSSEDLARVSENPSVPILDHGPRTNIHDQPTDDPKKCAFQDDFSLFWDRYPLKVGKKAALKAYQATRRKGATAGEIMEGLSRYLEFKDKAGERHHNPATFLGPNEWWAEEFKGNGGRPNKPDNAPEPYIPW